MLTHYNNGMFNFMKDVTALITCVGGVISPSQIESLRKNPDGRRVRIVGTDMTSPCVGQFLADKFYKVPSGTVPDYVEALANICSKESVDVVFPASHEEALSLAQRREVFDKIGTVIAVSKYNVLESAFNKKLAYEKLRDNRLPCPEFYVAKSVEEFEDAAVKLGIGRRKVVMKPPLARGGRGVRVLTKENAADYLLKEKPGYLEVDYDEVLGTLSQLERKEFPELVLMEYLPGDIYSVDFLTRNGEALIIVPKIRIVGNASQTLVGMVKRDTELEETVRKISRAFGFDYNINIEMKCNEQGVPLSYDINARIAASVAFCTAAGANLIYFALKMAMGEEVPNVEVQDRVMMLRYFEEIYAFNGSVLKA